MDTKRYLILLLLASCTANSPWKLDAIATGHAAFDSARLLYLGEAGKDPLRLEFLRTQEEIACFLSLTQFSFHAPKTLQAEFRTENGSFKEFLPLLEGKMRLRLSNEATEFLIRSLKDGDEVVILVDGFEKTFRPDGFPKVYDQWLKNSLFLINPLKGPIE